MSDIFDIEDYEEEIESRPAKRVGKKRIDWCGDMLDEIARIIGLSEKEIKQRHKEWKSQLTKAQKERADTTYRTFKYRYVIRKLEEKGAEHVSKALKKCLEWWLSKKSWRIGACNMK